ncbi:putative cysteine desulfurase [Planctomycetes bacterium Pan216]|uniref:Putative cysteine desulfurase n=1 Tax=Kolteria novifilia TaxID=2527975 RepID=A0A518B6J7_9BACT|nr:putative cysteine desulfurase [Planctomycetes bacterium Pan216]
MIYFNNAATTWPKPESVYDVVSKVMRSVESPGRSTSRESRRGAFDVEIARQRVASFLGIPDASRLVLTPGCTYSLNLAIQGLPWKRGDVALLTGLEHHAVSRPIRKMAEERGIRFVVVPYAPGKPVDLDFIEETLRHHRCRLVACTCASNVTGELLPYGAVAQIAREHGVTSLIDASQVAGVLPVDVAKLGADMVAFAGHKSLMGPMGVGGLYVRPELQLRTLVEGGTGKDSGKHAMSGRYPANFEVGTLNFPSIAGLAEGVKWIQETGIDRIRQHETGLTGRLLDGLRDMPGVTIHGPQEAEARTSVVSITVEGHAPRELADWLASEHDIATRAGYHCAPLAHESIGTLPGEGTLRFSIGYFNTAEEVDDVIECLAAATGVSSVVSEPVVELA